VEESVGRRATAEFVGMFTLVFAGMGAIAVGAEPSASRSRTASRSP